MDNNEFVKEYRTLVARSLSFDEEKFIQRNIFEYGLRLVVDGLDYKIIERILTNIVGPEAEGKFLSCGTRWQNKRGELGPYAFP
jgi:hypothetical protein